MQIRIQLFAFMRIRGSCSSSKLCEFLRASTAHHGSISELLKLLNFEFNADPDPTFHSTADLDPTLKDIAYPCGSGFATLPRSQLNRVSGRDTDGTRVQIYGQITKSQSLCEPVKSVHHPHGMIE
jgi:hypothetical protein